MANIFGTLGADSRTGTNVSDYISGGPLGNEAADTGNDTLRGGTGGFDVIYGWGGADSIVGSADGAYDALYGGVGNDTITIEVGEADGEAGNDSIIAVGAIGTDAYLLGGTGADTLVGAASTDYLYDNDYGGSLNADADSLSGGGGFDTLYSAGGADTLDGGADYDTAIIDRSGLVVGFRFTPTDAATVYVASDGTRVVNIENFESVYGGSGNDTLSGLDGIQEFYGNGGNDVITVFGNSSGSYNGRAFGGNGNDSITGQGLVFVDGEAGNDTINLVGGGEANGGDGDDTLISTGADGSFMAGGLGADSLVGGDGSDELFAENYSAAADSAADTLFGGGGNDQLYSYGGADSLDGGAGNDTATIDRSTLLVGFRFTPTAAGTAYVASDGTRVVNIESFERVAGGSGNDTLSGLGDFEAFYGNGGNDSITAGINGYADGGTGNDTISFGDNGYGTGGDGDDRLTTSGYNGNGIGLNGGGGNDTVIATSIDASLLYGGLGADSLVGGAGSDSLDGGYYVLETDNAADTLSGGDGDDVLSSYGGVDRLDGGAGLDAAIINRTSLTVNFSLTLGLPTAISTASDGTTLTGIETVQVVGGSAKDKLIANAGDDLLAGLAGNDLLNGGKGFDTLNGGDNADTLIGGAGNDLLTGGANADAFRWVALDKKVDQVADFDQGLDRLEFSSGAVGGLLPLGAPNAANFTLGTAATGAVPQFFYNTTTDTLFWDADGSGAIKSAVIVTFFNNPTLTAADIVIIA